MIEMLPEDVINDSKVDVYKRLDALIACYEQIVKISALDNMDSLNYWLRQELLNLRGSRRQFSGRFDMLEALFIAFDEKLFRLCLKEERECFVIPLYLPPTSLI